MTAPTIESDLSQSASRALVRGMALAELAAARCFYPELFRPQIEPFLRAEMETGEVHVVNERGDKRHGVSVRMFVATVKAEWNGRSPGRFFEK